MRTLVIHLLRFGLVAACGCSSSSSAAQSWAGTWTRSGTETTVCDGKSTSTPLGGTVSITLGSGSPTFETSVTCDLAWDVSGNADDSATLEPGSACAQSVSGANVTVAFTQGSATLDESTISGTLSGSASNGCTVTQSMTLARVAVVPQGSR